MSTATKVKLQNFIDGKFVDAADGATEDVTNPANGEVIAEMPLSTEQDVNRAVAAAKKAFSGWSATTPGERAAALFKLADALEEHAEEISDLEAADAGKSGYGKDMSMYALEDYTEVKHVMVNLETE